MNKRPTFQELKPLLVQREHDKDQGQVHCVFACPTTLRRVNSSAYVQQGSGIKDRVVDAVARSFWWELRGTVTRTIASFLPHGFLRNVVENAAWHLSYGSSDGVVTSEELNQATVDAFLSVSHEFVKEDGEWRAREVAEDFLTDFDRLVRSHPIATRYEAEVLSRVLVTVASLDGSSGLEGSFVEEFAGQASGEATPPSQVELRELEETAKPVVYLLASALAKVDQLQSREEGAYLQKLGQDLELSSSQVDELDKAAGQFVVERSLHTRTDPTSLEVRQLAEAVGLKVEEVERVLVRRRKREG